MSSEKHKYRNPPPPLGYEKKMPTLVVKEPDYEENINIHSVITMILNSKICDEPDVSIYEDFAINPGSDEEEVLEIPFIPAPKVVDVLDITEDDQNCESSRAETPGKDSVSLVKNKVSIVTETGCDASSTKVKKHKTHKKHHEVKKKKDKKRKSKSRKHKKCNYDKDDDSLSTESGDSLSNRKLYIKEENQYKKEEYYSSESDSHSRGEYGKKVNYGIDSDSHSKSRSKMKENYSSESDSHSRNQYKKKENYSSDCDSHNISRSKQKENYSSDSDSHSISKYEKRENYSSESDSCNRSRYKKKENYSRDCDYHSRNRSKKRSCSSDRDSNVRRQFKKISYNSEMDSFSKNQQKKCNSTRRLQIVESSSDSDSNRTYKKGKDYKVSPFYKELNDSDDNMSSESQNKQLSYFKSDLKSAKEQENSRDINTEQITLYGEYRCEICKVSSTNETTHQNHLKGKRHKKVLENLQNEEAAKEVKKKALVTSLTQGLQVTDLSILPNPTTLLSKYPKPPSGYYRIKLAVPSVIQDKLNDINFPFPGLHKVTEIWSVLETTYYCSLCDCNSSCNSIIQHLQGFKHQLNCLKYYRSDLYEKWSHKAKHIVGEKILGALKDEEKRHGRGLIKVEKDVRDLDMKTKPAVADLNALNNPSTSTQNLAADYFENYVSKSIPDPTKSGFYCKLCDSPCNSEATWNNHIVGKRHLANLKKLPGAAPSKCKYTPAEGNVHPILFDIIKDENIQKLPVVGLDQIREIRKPDINGVVFNCFLCGACVSSGEILDHILSLKHREKYLNCINHPDIAALKDCVISESSRSGIIADICERVEAEKGSGTPDVFYAKSSIRY